MDCQSTLMFNRFESDVFKINGVKINAFNINILNKISLY